MDSLCRAASSDIISTGRTCVEKTSFGFFERNGSNREASVDFGNEGPGEYKGAPDAAP